MYSLFSYVLVLLLNILLFLPGKVLLGTRLVHGKWRGERHFPGCQEKSSYLIRVLKEERMEKVVLMGRLFLCFVRSGNPRGKVIFKIFYGMGSDGSIFFPKIPFKIYI